MAEPGPDWERMTAWMNRSPNWKRVEPKMRALAVRRARCGRRSLRLAEDLKRADPTATARARAPEFYKASPYYRIHELSFLKTLRRPASASRIPRRIEMSPPRLATLPPLPPPPLPPARWKELYEKAFPRQMSSPPPRIEMSPGQRLSWWEEMLEKAFKEEANEGFKMILSAILEEMRDRLPPDSNPRRWFEGMLNNM